MFPVPRHGYLFVLPVKNPWGDKTKDGIIVAPAINAAPGSWYQVVEAFDGMYLQGSFVYAARSAAEPVVLCERTLGLLHESSIKATLPRDSFKPEFETVQTADFVAEIERSRERSQSNIVPAHTMPNIPRVALQDA